MRLFPKPDGRSIDIVSLFLRPFDIAFRAESENGAFGGVITCSHQLAAAASLSHELAGVVATAHRFSGLVTANMP